MSRSCSQASVAVSTEAMTSRLFRAHSCGPAHSPPGAFASHRAGSQQSRSIHSYPFAPLLSCWELRLRCAMPETHSASRLGRQFALEIFAVGRHAVTDDEVDRGREHVGFRGETEPIGVR